MVITSVEGFSTLRRYARRGGRGIPCHASVALGGPGWPWVTLGGPGCPWWSWVPLVVLVGPGGPGRGRSRWGGHRGFAHSWPLL